ncbi:MAG: phage tail sheath subtilisin-like domain-containing protein [Methylocystis sp.]|uniref:phage tail sheath subtilisin-like domain-containing protein n=1 Tax=Methylocystis sp. TaxID=1911079 RepID=UPI003DA48303
MPAELETSERLPLGLPGVYRLARVPRRELPATPMDVSAFVGLAERGPAWQPEPDTGAPDDWRLVLPDHPLRRSIPTLVESFDDYRRLFGSGSGGGLMMEAVRAYFEQGARRAWIVRILPPRDGAPDLFRDCAQGTLDAFEETPPGLFARNPGSWGARLAARLSIRRTRLEPTAEMNLKADQLAFDTSALVRVGDTLLINSLRRVRVASLVTRARSRIPGSVQIATLDGALATTVQRVDLIDADLVLDDGAGWVETHRGLGFAPGHPRWLATVLARESGLAWPSPSWADQPLTPRLDRIGADTDGAFTGGGDDENGAVAPEHMFDARWTLGDSADDRSLDGVQALLAIDEVTHVCVPDLYHPARMPDTAPAPTPGTQGACFETCLPAAPAPTAPPPPQVPALVIDPADPAGRAMIIALQQRCVDLCEATERFIALLDAPPGLSAREVMTWRGAFASAWAAVYAPWCEIAPRNNNGRALTRVPPSAVAAGVIAVSELESGVRRGPANRVAREVVALADRLERSEAPRLHQAGINLFSQETDGVRLIGARTTSRAFYDRQLNVRRMLLRLRRMLYAGMQWAVFEPSQPALWTQIEAMLDVTLREEWRQGGFAGATPETSYFISIDRSPSLLDRGELVVSVGVALVEPLEFIVIRLTRSGDGTLSLEEAA